MSDFRYIPEIDGLRAVAVVPVILFHLGLSWISGGFLGVDVFFVVSGYLITSILIKESDKRVSEYFYDFYMRRMRRIFPALFTMILVTLLVSYFVLLPSELLELARSALSAVGFFSNIFFYFGTGYFDGPAENMPLLHTWTLGVEEQFYIMWPVIILFLAKKSLIQRSSLIAVLFLASLYSSVYYTSENASLAFYNLPFRLYEFLLGAALPIMFNDDFYARLRARFIPAILQVFGLGLIGYSMVTFSSDDKFPGWLALLPALGTSLFIIGVRSSSGYRLNPMKSSLMVGIGKISFSLYLWHWPIIVFYSIYIGGRKLTPVEILVLIAIMAIVSVSSYFVIEKPLRRSQLTALTAKYSLASALIIIGVCFLAIQSSGFRDRLPENEKFSSPDEMWKWKCPNFYNFSNFRRKYCTVGDDWKTAERKILVWGDSHAEQLTPLLKLVAERNELSVLVIDRSCRPITDGKNVLLKHRQAKKATKGCMKMKRKVYDIIKQDKAIRLVMLVGAWRFSLPQVYSPDFESPNRRQTLNIFQEGLSNTAKELTSLGVDVLLMGDIPHPNKMRSECGNKNNLLRKNKQDCSPLPREFVDDLHAATEKILEEVASMNSGVYSHNIINEYCSDVSCPIHVNESFMYKDTNHIRRNFSRSSQEILVDQFGLNEAIDWTGYK
ncbi:MAG: acyltransferase family protein [Oceanicoccus sp.]